MLDNNINKKIIIEKLDNFIQDTGNDHKIELNLASILILKYIRKLDASYYKFIGEFSEDSFELEIQTNNSLILFIDLSLTFLDIRFNYFENNFFISEVEIEDIEKYFVRFFNGEYEIVSFYDDISGKVYKTKVIWKSLDMLKYNKEYTYKSLNDFFEKEKFLIESKKEGYKWKLV